MVMTIFRRMISTPTYLIAYVVSDYTYVSQTSTVLPRQRVYARPNAIAAGAGNYALNTGIVVIEELSKYFGIPYSLSKLDQVAVQDFFFGAMENWGIVTYRYIYIFFLGSCNRISNKQNIRNPQLQGRKSVAVS